MQKVFRLLSGAGVIAFLIWCAYFAFTKAGGPIDDQTFLDKLFVLIGVTLLTLVVLALAGLIIYSIFHFLRWIITGEFEGFR